MRQSKWEVWQATTGKAKGQWFFHLKTKNGKIVLQSEGYLKKRALLDTIRSIIRNADSVVEMKN
jgi:uncharacterized protein YegP (UPF0339 family)